MVTKTLPPLPGTAENDLWTGTNEFGPVNLSEAVFPIFRRIDSRSCEIVGTAFYVLRNGAFMTARHVLDERSDTLFGIQFGPGTHFYVRPVIAAYHHPTGDLSIGVLEGMRHRQTGKLLENKTLVIRSGAPPKGAPISTYSYPLHDVVLTDAGTQIDVRPTFYDGPLLDYYGERGPSAKLQCPYFLSGLHLYGASSGGPVFSTNGSAFAVANSSYDGANDIAFVTPIELAGDIIIKGVDRKDGNGSQDLPFREILNAHMRSVSERRRSAL